MKKYYIISPIVMIFLVWILSHFVSQEILGHIGVAIGSAAGMSFGVWETHVKISKGDY